MEQSRILLQPQLPQQQLQWLYTAVIVAFGHYSALVAIN